MSQKEFLKKWILANTLGFLIGYILYTPIGHGITGNHGFELNTNQIIAHCIALSVVALILVLFQKSVLRHFISISKIRIAIAISAFVILFWFGYYQTIIPGELDYDILFGYLALGTGLWIGSLSPKKNMFKWLLALLSFPIASFIGEVILFIIYSTFDLNMDIQNSTVNHMVFWITVGVSTGIIGGWLSGLMLYKMLPKSPK